jgi:hypothetical protein
MATFTDDLLLLDMVQQVKEARQKSEELLKAAEQHAPHSDEWNAATDRLIKAGQELQTLETRFATAVIFALDYEGVKRP